MSGQLAPVCSRSRKTWIKFWFRLLLKQAVPATAAKLVLDSLIWLNKQSANHRLRTLIQRALGLVPLAMDKLYKGTWDKRQTNLQQRCNPASRDASPLTLSLPPCYCYLCQFPKLSLSLSNHTYPPLQNGSAHLPFKNVTIQIISKAIPLFHNASILDLRWRTVQIHKHRAKPYNVMSYQISPHEGLIKRLAHHIKTIRKISLCSGFKNITL